VTRKERDFITLRFRKQLDDDLKEAVKKLEDGMLSNLVRDGLRLMLGIRTTKKIEVTEIFLSVPIGLHEISHVSAAQGNERQVDHWRTSQQAAGKPLLNTDIKKDGGRK
jgi:Arc/MetJ-type ribon-helix-helix transcriptional regulator